jgi:glutamate N-acetyltransferase / amino-acid N-acetyltransferase
MKVPRGYQYSALYAGIRKVNKPDLALIVSQEAAAAAAMFTTNRVQAAPVLAARQHLKETRGKVRAILVNAGNANCATRTGARVAAQTAKAAAKAIGAQTNEVLPASTGVIGVDLDASLILNALPDLAAGLSPDRFLDAADAILTTDTVRKVAWAETDGVCIAGMTKGSGMIQPNMATTLGFVMTDAQVSVPKLRAMLHRTVESSYHRLSVDGDTSTNDAVILLANGASGKKPGADFEAALDEVFESLAIQIARDGEGASKLIEIDVAGAKDYQGAAAIARAIANSPLVKTAVAGSDPNWGRILSAAGYSGIRFDPSSVDVYLQGVRVCRKGLAADYDEPGLQTLLSGNECQIRFVIEGRGKGTARFWTCDFTEGYIRINGSYRT